MAVDEVPGLGPKRGFTQAVCTTRHASAAYDAYLAFLHNPGPVIVGAAAGASCFGPAYEVVMILDRDLRKRKLRDRVPMTTVTPAPYIGHLGLDGFGASRGLMEDTLRPLPLKEITKRKDARVRDGQRD